MADIEFSGKPKLSLFSRSLTMHAVGTSPPNNHQPLLERGGSMKRPYRSIEPPKSSLQVDEGPQAVSRLPSRQSSGKSTGSFFDKGPAMRLTGTQDRIVVFFTSLRGIRRTYEDCYSVRMIFEGFRVRVDERDLSMDLAYRKELQCLLGEKNVNLPRVFIRGKYAGGADVIKQLYETGELAQILEGLPKRASGSVCNSCGDVKFVPCSSCSGSRKVFHEDEGIHERCSECNENGLVRCPNRC